MGAECIDPGPWHAAQAACAAKISVKGFGYVATGLRGLRGLGVPAPSDQTAAFTISTASSDPNDPCYIASLPMCAAQPAPHSLTAAPNAAALLRAQRPPSLTAATPPPVKRPPAQDSGVPVQSASMTGGFSQWGLLAIVAVGGFVVYKVATHKKAS